MTDKPNSESQLSFRFSGADSTAANAAESATDEPRYTLRGYSPGHPWYYLARGDEAAVIPVDQIPPPFPADWFAPRTLPTNRAKRIVQLRSLYEEEQLTLAADRRRYEQIIEEGVSVLSWYDREVAYGGDAELAWAGSIALAYNHIVFRLGRVGWLRKELGLPIVS
jgi:hypothetical protein